MEVLPLPSEMAAPTGAVRFRRTVSGSLDRAIAEDFHHQYQWGAWLRNLGDVHEQSRKPVGCDCKSRHTAFYTDGPARTEAHDRWSLLEQTDTEGDDEYRQG